MTSVTPKTIVVFGATSKQAQGLIEDLSKSNTPAVQYRIVALARDASTSTSKRLASLPGVQVRQVRKDYMDDAARTYRELGVAKGDVWGVFSIQGYVGEAEDIKQGKSIADASHALGVEVFVYSGVDFGLADVDIPMFHAKRVVRDHVASLSPPTMALVYLAPPQFMDNLLPTAGTMFRMGRTVLLRHTFVTHPDRKHQLVSTRDIGRAGAVAFRDPGRWAGRTMRLAGDELTVAEIQKVYREVMGEPIDETLSFVAGIVKRMVPIMRTAAKFFDEQGFQIDVAEFKREILPDAEDLRTFLQRYKAQTARR